ncbi:MAG: hypothetical protein ACC608_08570 [Anaerofustis sp.]
MTWLPQALVIGVSYDLFWTLNPKTLEPFIEAFKQKQIAKRDEINLSAWLTGRMLQMRSLRVSGRMDSIQVSRWLWVRRIKTKRSTMKFNDLMLL